MKPRYRFRNIFSTKTISPSITRFKCQELQQNKTKFLPPIFIKYVHLELHLLKSKTVKTVVNPGINIKNFQKI